MQNVNTVVITGNLTRDPELRSTPGGTSVTKLRIAVNTRRKDSSGAWIDKANFFDVTVWGSQGEACAKYLAKGSPVAIEGRLEWREWESQEGGKRQAVEIVAGSVQFLGYKDEASTKAEQEAPTEEEPEADRQLVGVGADGEEIPF
jgi:single-strand DNA-binding protein